MIDASAGRGSVCSPPLTVLREQLEGSFPLYARGGFKIKLPPTAEEMIECRLEIGIGWP